MIPRDYKYVVETGIYGRLSKEFYTKKNFKRKRADEWKPLPDKMTMDDFISTLFIICAEIAGLWLVALCAECIRG